MDGGGGEENAEGVWRGKSMGGGGHYEFLSWQVLLFES